MTNLSNRKAYKIDFRAVRTLNNSLHLRPGLENLSDLLHSSLCNRYESRSSDFPKLQCLSGGGEKVWEVDILLGPKNLEVKFPILTRVESSHDS